MSKESKIHWVNSEKYKGVRWYYHEDRKHGVQFDRCFGIRYQVGGKRIESVLGWASSGMTEKQAMLKRERYIENYRKGEGPISKKDEDAIVDQKRDEENKQKELAEKEALSFAEYFEQTYLPAAKLTKKPKTISAEKGYFENWLKPVLGKMPFMDIYPLHFEKVKQNMIKKKKAMRSVQYCLAISRQIWNMARLDRLTDREPPSKEILRKLPKIDNQRMRFLTHDEAERLLEDLLDRSQQLHDMALLSLHTGMRAGEIFGLKWAVVDIDQGLIYIVDAKGGSRTGHMTEEVKVMFENRKRGQPNELVFKDRMGKQIKEASNSFDRAVNDLGLNNGVTDRRQKVLFHSLRHTFASWLVQQGEPLYTVQKLMGHASIAMTERYSHLAPDNLKTAVKNFEKNLKDAREKNVNRKKEEMENVVNLNEHKEEK